MFDMGKRICKLRRDAHLSQKQLGEKIGKSASTIGSYENDTAVPTLENAAALAEALHVSLDYLLYGEKSRTLPLQKMSENRVQLLTDLAQEFAAPTSHGAAFSDRKLDILRRLYQDLKEGGTVNGATRASHRPAGTRRRRGRSGCRNRG